VGDVDLQQRPQDAYTDASNVRVVISENGKWALARKSGGTERTLET